MSRDYKDKEKLDKRLKIFESSISSEEKLDLLKNYELEENVNLLDLVFESKNLEKLELNSDSLVINGAINLKSPNYYEIANSVKSDPVDLIAMMNKIPLEDAKEIYEDIKNRRGDLNSRIFDIDKGKALEVLKKGKQYNIKSEDILKDFNIVIDDGMYQKRSLEIDELEKAVDRDIKTQERLDRDAPEIESVKDRSLEEDFPIEKYGGPELWFYRTYQTLMLILILMKK